MGPVCESRPQLVIQFDWIQCFLNLSYSAITIPVFTPLIIYLIFFFKLIYIFIVKCLIFCLTVYRILVPRPGIEPGPPAVEAQSPNYWTTREFPCS